MNKRALVSWVLVCIVLVLLGTQRASADTTNILTNPGFETGDFTGWTHTASSAQVENSYAYSGTYGGEVWSQPAWIKQENSTGFPSGTTVYVSCWFEQDHNGHGTLTSSVWFFYGRENGDVTSNWAVTLSDPPAWQQVAGSFVTTGTNDSIGFRAGLSASGAYYGFIMDDCSMTTSQPQPTFTPQATFTSFPTSTPYPTYTPAPTYTPLLTNTPYSTSTPWATYTVNPTYTPFPTFTPLPALPTNTPYDTSTPYNTATPYQTYTPVPPYPTLTPWPTDTPLPTYTVVPPYPTYTSVPPLPTYTPRPTYTPLPGTAVPSRTPGPHGGPIDISGIPLTTAAVGQQTGLILLLPWLMAAVAVVIALALAVEIFHGLQRAYNEIFHGGVDVPAAAEAEGSSAVEEEGSSGPRRKRRGWVEPNYNFATRFGDVTGPPKSVLPDAPEKLDRSGAEDSGQTGWKDWNE